MWAGRTAGVTDPVADDFNSSIRFDSRMYREDITGSMAHAAMLGAQHILPSADADAIIDALQGIFDDLDSGALAIDPACEDIHMFVEQVLTARIGDLGKKLHTARSRNDQVALDLRMYLRNETSEVIALTKDVLAALVEQAGAHKGDILPGYTHLQRAQPITFGHHLMAYAMMLLRDIDRMQDAVRRMNVSPIGCCALAGTTYDTDRFFEAHKLGFDDVARNSLDGVSDRDFCVELLDAYAIEMMHLSRLSEELVLWSSWEFQFVQLSDSYTTGSSIMPQKKNPDMAELVRGKTGRVYGDLIAMLTALKGLPLAYNKDMQEDKEAVFDAVDTVKMCLRVMAPMLATMTVRAVGQTEKPRCVRLGEYRFPPFHIRPNPPGSGGCVFVAQDSSGPAALVPVSGILLLPPTASAVFPLFSFPCRSPAMLTSLRIFALSFTNPAYKVELVVLKINKLAGNKDCPKLNIIKHGLSEHFKVLI